MKVFVIVMNHDLKAVVSNKQKVWEKALKLMKLTDEIIEKESIIVETYHKWKGKGVADFTRRKTQTITKQTQIYPIFKEYKNISLIDPNDEDNVVTIAERMVNE